MGTQEGTTAFSHGETWLYFEKNPRRRGLCEGQACRFQKAQLPSGRENHQQKESS